MNLQRPDRPSRALQLTVRGGVVLLACAALAASAAFAYLQMFSQFQIYDDEGYVMASVRTFLDGQPLYDRTFTQYGPFYYFAAWLFYRVSGLPVGHDVTRLLTIGLWLATAAGCAAFVYRVTRSVGFALAAYLQIVVHCTGLIGEPGHPQGLIEVLVICLLVVAAGPPVTPAGSVLLGILTAALLLIKINVGAYVAGALTVVFLASAPGNRATRVMLLATSVALVMLPFIVMRMHLSTWAWNYALTSASAIAAGCIAAWNVRVETVLPVRRFVFFVAPLVATAMLLIAFAIASGSSLGALIDGVVLAPVRFGSVFTIPLTLPSRSVTYGIVSIVLALAVTRLDPSGRLLQPVSLACKIGFGLWMGLAATRDTTAMMTIAPFAWVVLLPVDRGPCPLERLIPRAALCLLAATQSLVAYPVAGNQQAWATLPLVPAALVSLADVWSFTSGRIGFQLRRAAEVVLVGLVVYWYYPSFQPQALLQRYRAFASLDLPRSQRIRVPAAQAVTYQALVTAIRRDCDTFITMPGLNSLYFWSRKPFLTGLNATTWMTLFDDATQQRIVDRLSEHPLACAVYDEGLMNGWIGGRNVDNGPLVQYIRHSFHTVRTIDRYQFMLRNDRPGGGGGR